MAKIKLTKKHKKALQAMKKAGLIAYNPKEEGGETKVKGKKPAAPLTAEEVRRFRKYDLEERTKQAKGPRMKRRMAKRKVNPMESDEELSRLAHQKIDEEQRATLWKMASLAALPTDLMGGGAVLKGAYRLGKAGVKGAGKMLAKGKAKRAAAKSLKKLKKGGVTRAAGRPAFKGRTEAAPKPAGKPKKRRTSPQQRTPGRGVVSGRTHRTSPSHMRPDGTTSPRLPAVDVLKNAGIRNADKMSDVQQRAALATLFGGKAAAVAAAKKAAKAAAKKTPKKAAAKAKPKRKPAAKKPKPKKVEEVAAKPAQAAPKGPTVAEQKAAVAQMKDAKLKKELKKLGLKWRSRDKAIKVIQNRVARAARAAKPTKAGAKPRPQRRTAAVKGEPAASAKPKKPKKTETPKTATTSPDKGVNLAAELGYKSPGKQKALNTFFESRGVSTVDDLITKRGELVSGLGRVRGGTNKVASGGGLGKRIDALDDVRGAKGAGSPIPKPLDAGQRVAQGRTRDRTIEELEDDIAERAARDAADTAYPVLASAKGIRGARKLYDQMRAGTLRPAKFYEKLKPLLDSATPAQRRALESATEFLDSMTINMAKAKKAGKVRAADVEALKRAHARVIKMMASLGIMVGAGAAAE